MSYPLYKVLHILGGLFLFAGLGGLILQQLRDGGGETARKLAGLTHGLALILLLVTGFGAVAKLGANLMAPWVVGKMILWLVIGAMPVLIRRMPRAATVLWWLVPLLGGLAGYLAVYKPGG